jgi:hypothetical protein
MGKYVTLGNKLITVKLMSIKLPILAEISLSYPEWLDRLPGPSPSFPASRGNRLHIWFHQGARVRKQDAATNRRVFQLASIENVVQII